MDPSVIVRFFTENWQKKLIALVGALFTWMLVNETITSTKTIDNVPVRLINLPADRTAAGLQPNGTLESRVTLTITGNRDLIESIEPGDIEATVDAAQLPNESVLKINKKDLVSLNPDLQLSQGISQVSNSELVIRMSYLVTEEIPVKIAPPTGSPPPGYELLDIVPHQLYHQVTGPQDLVEDLALRGLVLRIDLDRITKEQLDQLEPVDEDLYADVVNLPLSEQAKSVELFDGFGGREPINDPNADEIYLAFIRQRLLPLSSPLPIRLFFPKEHLETLNPSRVTVQKNDLVASAYGQDFFNPPLLIQGVSRAFLHLVQDKLELIVMVTDEGKGQLDWTVDAVHQQQLEDLYIRMMLPGESLYEIDGAENKQVSRLRRRFRHYLNAMQLYTADGHPLDLNIQLDENRVVLQNAAP